MYTPNRNVRISAGVHISHLNLDSLIRVGIAAVSCSLFDKLLSVGQNKGLRCVLPGDRDSVNELCKDDLHSSVPCSNKGVEKGLNTHSLTGSSRQRDSKTLVAFLQV